MTETPTDFVSSQPYWSLRNGLLATYPSVETDLRCEVAIIGGGISGALILHALTRSGIDTILLERGDIGHASTSASTALLQYELDTPLHELRTQLGHKDAEAAYRLCARGVERVRELTREFGSAVPLEEKNSLYLASDVGAVEKLRAEFLARRDAGLPVEWLDAEGLRELTGVVRPAAIRSAGAACVDPFALTHALLRSAHAMGARIFDRSAMGEFRPQDSGVEVRTERGPRIHARRLVFANGYASAPFLPKDAARLVSSFAFATKPRPKMSSDDFLLWETARPYLYVRSTADGRHMVGGGDVAFRNAKLRDALLPAKIHDLRQKAEELLGTSLEPVYGWAGTFAETPDGIPYAGELARYPRCLFACAFGGNGIAFAAEIAELLRVRCQGETSPYDRLLGFERLERREPSA